jgi:SAM-dependent methyltransferase
LMAEDSSRTHDAALIDTILPLVPGLPARLEAGIDVADVGCGRGHAINLMAHAFPNSRFVGYDFSEEGVQGGRDEAQRLGLTNARFEARDVTNLAAREQFDLITAFDAIHDQAQPARVLAGIAEALRPDGVFLMVDIGASSHAHENMEFPLAPMMYTISCMHCMTVSLALDGAGLGAMWGEQKAREMLAEAGFTQVEIKRIEDDLFNSYYVATKEVVTEEAPAPRSV